MTRISKVLAVPAAGALYFEDLSALQAGATKVGGGIARGATQAVSVGLVLDDGQVAWGDCVAMAQSGRGGRHPSFRSADGLDTIRRAVAPALEGRALTSFRELSMEVDALIESVQETRPLPPKPEPVASEFAGDDVVEDASRRALFAAAARLLRPLPDEDEEDAAGSGVPPQDEILTEQVAVERPLHPAVRYGVSQALLRAVAMVRGLTMAEVVAEEWGLPRPSAPVPIHALSGPDRYLSADKMIVRRVESLPDAPIDNMKEHLGDEGFKLSSYLRWLVGRIQELASDGYRPTIHLDLNGALGQLFENDMGKVLGKLYGMEFTVKPYRLRVENPVVMESREEQIDALKTLRRYVQFRKMNVQLVADEWANTLDDIQAFLDAEVADMVHIKMPELGGLHNSIEAVLACQANDVGAYLGGSPAETNLAARVAVHVALATRPQLLMAKPGTGVDEAISLAQNEMARSLAWIRARGD
jgi:methylaspartate ammonia-lyase